MDNMATRVGSETIPISSYPSGDIQLNPGPVARLSPVQNVQLKTAETKLVCHVNTGGTEPMDFFHMESFADPPRANSDFTSHQSENIGHS
ncbi:unnamed protein product [Boreogadus saida]